MTSAERDLIVNVGLLIYNTSTSNFNYFDLEWKDSTFQKIFGKFNW
jgi:hypothetical protein